MTGLTARTRMKGDMFYIRDSFHREDRSLKLKTPFLQLGADVCKTAMFGVRFFAVVKGAVIISRLLRLSPLFISALFDREGALSSWHVPACAAGKA